MDLPDDKSGQPGKKNGQESHEPQAHFSRMSGRFCGGGGRPHLQLVSLAHQGEEDTEKRL